MSYDLFISYSRRDNTEGRVSTFVEQIGAEFAAFSGRPLRPFFDVRDIRGMDDWRRRILLGLRESHILLACLSPAYLESPYCEWEFNEYLKHEIDRGLFGGGVAPIYFVEVPEWNDKDFEKRCAGWVTELRRRQHVDLRPWFRAGQSALRDQAVQERMHELNLLLRERILRGERIQHSLGNVDAHNPHFFGRRAELTRIRELLSLGRVGVLTAIHGLGGIGKTALAVEYGHYFADQYGGGRWQVRCEGQSDLRAAIRQLAAPLRITYTKQELESPDLQTQRVLAELHSLAFAKAPHHCLLILDNVDESPFLSPARTKMLPGEDWLHILVTTRLGESELFARHDDRAFVSIDEVTEADAVEIIESYQPDRRFASEGERKAAHEIARLLGCFTLAVEAAAVYLGEFAADISCNAFLARLQKEGIGGLDIASRQGTEGIRHGEKELLVTMSSTLNRMTEAELCVLNYAGHLPADDIPIVWLRKLAARSFPEFGHDAEPGYPDAWKTLLRRLLGLRFFRVAETSAPGGVPISVSIHRLVQQLIRQRQTNPAEITANLKRYLSAFLLEVLNERATIARNIDRVIDMASSLRIRLRKARQDGPEAVRDIVTDPALADLRNVDYATTVDLFLSLRDTRDYVGMLSLIDRMPVELAATRVIRRQYSFALSRIGQKNRAATVLLDVLRVLGPDGATYGLLGRIYKEMWNEAKRNSLPNSVGLLQQAIEAYSAGFDIESSDGYLGINAVTLMEMLQPPDSRQAQILPAARNAARRALQAMQSRGKSETNFWEYGTLLELAVLARDFVDAEQCLNDALASLQQPWEAETIEQNLRMIREVREQRNENTSTIAGIEADLKKAAEQIRAKNPL